MRLVTPLLGAPSCYPRALRRRGISAAGGAAAKGVAIETGINDNGQPDCLLIANLLPPPQTPPPPQAAPETAVVALPYSSMTFLEPTEVPTTALMLLGRSSRPARATITIPPAQNFTLHPLAVLTLHRMTVPEPSTSSGASSDSSSDARSLTSTFLATISTGTAAVACPLLNFAAACANSA